MIFWEMERVERPQFCSRMSLANQRCAIKLLSINGKFYSKVAFDAVHALITDGLPTVEATCDGMRPFASVLSRPSVGG